MFIRRASTADAGPIAAVHVASWQQAYKGLLPGELLAGLSADQRELTWRRVLEEDNDIVLVCEKNEAVVGFAALGPSRDEDAEGGAVAELYAIYLDASAWGQGYGRTLCAAGMSELRQQGYAIVTLWVLDSNKSAIKFYEAMGFAADGAVKQETLPLGVPVREVRYRQAL